LRTRIASRDSSSGCHGTQLRQHLQGGILAWPFIDLEQLGVTTPLWDGHWHNFFSKFAALHRGYRALMTAQGVGILLFTSNMVAFR
jgi:hypothetical protein